MWTAPKECIQLLKRCKNVTRRPGFYSPQVGDIRCYVPLSDLEVDDEEHDAEEDADTTDDEIRDAEERVLTAQPRGGRQDEPLRPVKHRHRVI